MKQIDLFDPDILAQLAGVEDASQVFAGDVAYKSGDARAKDFESDPAQSCARSLGHKRKLSLGTAPTSID